jgi:catechol 2,3-dioxygenase-like lactoylglutathione lyase family enzyme
MHNRYGLTFHHLGLAAKAPARTIGFLEGLGYRPGDRVRDELQNVDLVMCAAPSMPSVEVISATETEGPLESVLKPGVTEAIYHVCYESDDLDATLEAMRRDSRVICVSPRKPAVLFGGRHVSFYRVAGFGLLEILEPR